MSIGFQFTTIVEHKHTILETLQRLSKQFGYQFFSGEDWAQVVFCRMGDVRFHFAKQQKEPLSTVALSCDACTSTAGAGFHAAAIHFVDALVVSEHLKIEMQDETDYYSHRDFARMRKEHFYSWLEMLVEHCARNNSGQRNLCLCWSLDQYMPEEIAGSVVTPFGRFHISSLVELVQREGIEAFAQMFFLWNEQERDARFYRNCALSVLWEDCCFQDGNRSKEDSTTNQTAIDLLEQAIALDASFPIPKEEYVLLCNLQGHFPVDVSACPNYPTAYSIGFRRSMVTYRIGNTSLKIQGSFLMEEDENATVWFDGQAEHWHNLRVSAFGAREGNATFSPRVFENTAEPMEEFEVGDGKGRAAFAGEQKSDDGGIYYNSIAQIICQKQTTLITASYQDIEEKAWAMALFKQIQAHTNTNETAIE